MHIQLMVNVVIIIIIFTQISSASLLSFLPYFVYTLCDDLIILHEVSILFAALSMVFSTVLMMVDFIIPCVTNKKVCN